MVHHEIITDTKSVPYLGRFLFEERYIVIILGEGFSPVR